MGKLKRVSPELSRLVAQLVYARHKEAAMRETAETRALLAEVIRRGRDPRELMKALLSGAGIGGTTDRPVNEGEIYGTDS